MVFEFGLRLGHLFKHVEHVACRFRRKLLLVVRSHTPTYLWYLRVANRVRRDSTNECSTRLYYLHATPVHLLPFDTLHPNSTPSITVAAVLYCPPICWQRIRSCVCFYAKCAIFTPLPFANIAPSLLVPACYSQISDGCVNQ